MDDKIGLADQFSESLIRQLAHRVLQTSTSGSWAQQQTKSGSPTCSVCRQLEFWFAKMPFLQHS